jgi:hypothetical protein
MKKDIKVIPLPPLQVLPAERAFIDALKTYGKGLEDPADEPLIKASRELAEVVQSVRAFGGKGQVTLSIAVSGNAGKQVAVVMKVAAKKQERTSPTRLLYGDDSGRITTMDPDQMVFDDLLQESIAAHA